MSGKNNLGPSVLSVGPLSSVSVAPGFRAYSERDSQGGAARFAPSVSVPPLAEAPFPSVLRGGELPLSFAQERLWFLDQLEPQGSAYNLLYTLRLSGPLDRAALNLTMTALVERHETLRTRYGTVDGTPMQSILAPMEQSVGVTDLRSLSAEEQAAETNGLSLRFAQTPYDLAGGVVWRTHLLQLDAELHLLLIGIHHIATDRWSRGILLKEIPLLYAACHARQPASLPPLSIQYADFATWQREGMPHMAAQRAYWKTQLADLPMLDLRVDRARPPVMTYAGEAQRVLLNVELTRRLKALSRRSDTTLYMTMLAAFSVLLSRHSGQEDIVVGSPIANRNRAEIEGVVGCFVNLLVLRTDVSGDPAFQTLLERVRQTTLEAYTHQDMPFEALVDALQPERSWNRNPLFQVMLAQNDMPIEAVESAGVTFQEEQITFGASPLDLTVVFRETVEGLECRWAYNTDLFEPLSIGRMQEHFRTLLEGIVADPSQPVSGLPMLSASERKQLLVEWNATDVSTPSACVHTLFEEQVRRTPNASALSFEGRFLTYQELDQRANQFAHYLQRQGVGPGSLVSLYLERSLEMVIGLLGILKAGGAYVPLDAAYPAERLAFVLRDSGARLVLTQASLASSLSGYDGKCVLVDDLERLLAELPISAPTVTVSLSDLAYVIYTSGSTGKPKGVAMPHGALANLLHWQQAHWTGTPAARTLQYTSIGFDVSFQEILATLQAGGTLVLVEDNLRRDSEALLEFLATERIERLFLPFVALSYLAQTANQVGRYPQCLREIITAGEQLHITPDLARFMEALSSCALINQYGPTESHVVSAYRLEGSPSKWPVLPPIGHPVWNTRLYVLDHTLTPAPVGVIGELYIGGAQLGTGYLNRSDLTAERFVPDPFNSEVGGRLYRTGDLCRYLSDGNIEYIGRRDHQVKIRGHRIELGEIEAVLAEHPEVSEVTVLAQEEAPGEKRLIAYVAPRGTRDDMERELRGFLSTRLPQYMLPSRFVFVTVFPLSPNGKVDLRQLASLPMEPAEERTSTEETLGVMEGRLKAIWERMLDKRLRNIDENFFDLGGHSLMAIRLLSEVRREFDAGLTLAEMLMTPTVREMARLLRSKGQGSDAWTPVVPLKPQGARPPLFCAPTGGGSAFYYRTLVAYLDPEQPFYVFEPIGMSGNHEPHETCEEMAAYYIRHMRTVQPQGPYSLCGFSFGGVVAYEMARQLIAAGEKVECLLLLDTSAPRLSSTSNGELIADKPLLRMRRWREKVSFRIGFHLQNMAACPTVAAKSKYALSHAALQREKVKARRAGTPWETFYVNPSSVELPEVYQKVEQAETYALERYRPDGYAGSAILLRARLQKPEFKAEPLLGWDGLVADLKVIETPGTHYTLLEEPCVHVTVGHVHTALAAARAAR